MLALWSVMLLLFLLPGAFAAQTYPAISPVGAVVTPGHPVHFTIVGLPSGTDVSADDWGGGDEYLSQDSDGLGATFGYTGGGNSIDIAVAFPPGIVPDDSLSLSPSQSSSDADFRAGVPVPPPSGKDVPAIDYSGIVGEVVLDGVHVLLLGAAAGIGLCAMYAAYHWLSGFLARRSMGGS